MSIDQIEWGVGLVLTLLFVGWQTAQEIRIRNLEGSLALSKEKVIDDTIVQKVHALSDADLHAEVTEFLGGDKPSA